MLTCFVFLVVWDGWRAERVCTSRLTQRDQALVLIYAVTS